MKIERISRKTYNVIKRGRVIYVGNRADCVRYMIEKNSMKVLWIVVILLIVFCSFLQANEPPCEIYNLDTYECELYAEQNLTINTEWQEIVKQSKTWTEEELQDYLNK